MIEPVSLSAQLLSLVSRPDALPQTSFADALAVAADAAMTRVNDAEIVAARGLTGEASAREVADAVMSAERTLQTAIAVRDKVVTAWLDISRMAI